jgi:hypothetical protein
MLQLVALAGTGKGGILTREHLMAVSPLAFDALKSGVVWDEEEILLIFQQAHDELQPVEEFKRRLELHFETKIRDHEIVKHGQGSLFAEEPAPQASV